MVFMDLVAHLLRKNLGLLSKEEDAMLDGKNFKFVFYLSFQKREDSMGLELVEGLQSVCREKNLTNFQLVIRDSSVTK